ncbi:MAG: hypothetical protein KGL39_35635 [Patescibacteria group bacterium]|nr:hypothetical protein [Patescibacteria group bacterium]
MKKLLALAALIALSIIPAPAQQIKASAFAQWRLAGQQPLLAGSNSVVPFGPCTATAGSTTFNVLAASTPVRIVDPANPSIDETVTPTNIAIGQSNCTVTLAPANAHPMPYYLISGTAGLQEAINNGAVSGQSNTIVLDQAFHILGGGAGTIGSVSGSGVLPLIDNTVSPETAWRSVAGAYATSFSADTVPTLAAGAAAGTSPTVANAAASNGNILTADITSGTATTTGTLFTETYSTGGFTVAPNCTVQSVGNNSAPSFTYANSAASGHGVITVTSVVAPAASTAYVFNISCN